MQWQFWTVGVQIPMKKVNLYEWLTGDWKDLWLERAQLRPSLEGGNQMWLTCICVRFGRDGYNCFHFFSVEHTAQAQNMAVPRREELWRRFCLRLEESNVNSRVILCSFTANYGQYLTTLKCIFSEKLGFSKSQVSFCWLASRRQFLSHASLFMVLFPLV